MATLRLAAGYAVIGAALIVCGVIGAYSGAYWGARSAIWYLGL